MEDLSNMDWDSIVLGWTVIFIGLGGSYAMYSLGEYPLWLYMSAVFMLTTISIARYMNE